MKTLVTRLKPGAELRSQIEKLAEAHNIKAGYIITCVGGLSHVTCRMAGATPAKQDVRDFKAEYEIISLVGTVSTNGCHLHISFSDKAGKTLGGHLKSATINPTAEIVIGIEDSLTFSRKLDDETGFDELTVS